MDGRLAGARSCVSTEGDGVRGCAHRHEWAAARMQQLLWLRHGHTPVPGFCGWGSGTAIRLCQAAPPPTYSSLAAFAAFSFAAAAAAASPILRRTRCRCCLPLPRCFAEHNLHGTRTRTQLGPSTNCCPTRPAPLNHCSHLQSAPPPTLRCARYRCCLPQAHCWAPPCAACSWRTGARTASGCDVSSFRGSHEHGPSLDQETAPAWVCRQRADGLAPFFWGK